VAGAILAAIRISTGVLAFSIILSCILWLVRSVQRLVTPLGFITSNKMVPLLTVLHSFICPGSHAKYDGPTSEGSGLKQNPNLTNTMTNSRGLGLMRWHTVMRLENRTAEQYF